MSTDARPDLTVYYDGACPVCSREIAVYRRQSGADACGWVDVSQAPAEALGPDLTPNRALERLHVRRADGRLVHGAAAFALMWQALPSTRWLGRIAGIPPVTWMLEAAYRLFLRLRPMWRPAGAASPSPQAADETPASAAAVPGMAASQASALTPALIADLRSDHAGETGAVFIYRGILAVARDPALRSFAQHHLATESDHLAQIEAWLPPAQRSRLLPLWRVAGWVTGALPALFGPAAVYRTIQAVETFVDAHYAEQIERIDGLPPDATRAELRALLVACQADEVAHRDDAAGRLDNVRAAGGIARAWTACVGSGSKGAVALARRI